MLHVCGFACQHLVFQVILQPCSRVMMQVDNNLGNNAWLRLLITVSAAFLDTLLQLQPNVMCFQPHMMQLVQFHHLWCWRSF